MQKRQRVETVLISLIVGGLLVLGIGGFLVHRSYQDNLSPLNNSERTHVVTVKPGSTTAEIADSLKAKGIIKSDWAFEWYVRNHQLRDQLKAGTYVLGEAQSVPEIIQVLVEGRVATDLVTILPGQRLDQIRKTLIDNGFTAEDVDAALDPAQYAGHPALTDKPEKASLEGYLYPESFQKTSETKVGDIIKLALDEMQIRLTAEVRQGFSQKGLTVHQGIIIASIVEQEVSKAQDRPQVAQVFLKRYREGMQLGSDVTAFYGAIINGREPTVFDDSQYNTRKYDGLPAGAISNVSESSLQAVAFPAQTDWVYFVAGDDGTTHFSKTLAEHEALTRQYCIKLCAQ